jgi:hypothetical protein
MPISKSSKYSRTKHQSHWELMDGIEKFMAVFIIATFGFFIYMVFFS